VRLHVLKRVRVFKSLTQNGTPKNWQHIHDLGFEGLIKSKLKVITPEKHPGKGFY